MALKAWEEKITNRLKYITTGLKQHGYPYLEEAYLAFSQILNCSEKNTFTKQLMYNNPYVKYICDRITQLSVPEESYEFYGGDYHRGVEAVKRYSNLYWGQLFKPGNYQNNKEQFLEQRRTSGPHADIYSLPIVGIREASKNLDSRFMCYFINEDSLVHKHLEIIKMVLHDLQKKATDWLWLPLMDSPSNEVKNTLKDIIEEYSVAHRGLGLKFQNAVTPKQLSKTLTTLAKYLSQVELETLRRLFWLSQHHPLKPNVPPQLFLPRIKDAESIIKKMENYAKTKNYGREILLSDITDITGACLAVEDYFAIENTMNLIKASIPRDFILEEENLFYKNKKEKPYRDVKYIIRLSHPSPSIPPSNHICYELQIKTIDSKIFHDIDHAGIYKGNLSLYEEELLKQPFWGQLWIKEKQLLEEYTALNKEYQRWCYRNFPS
ncbi:hypothetical protein NO2_0582 [Candidatus Termititenax persephonae]|uniref:RelA/SpoT domain-containing protein n=1 Tax=Candidatus Termititenax persephonae TaxID=2218525 RepID=A0A388TH09_9BACT|nr:hypothetical protein NO2_0582 [Candidatus Termititenax persephonae]